LKSATAVASLVADWHQKTDDLGTITVPVTTLDKAIEQYGVPAFCKIDVEGFEAEVLKGLSHPISTLILEYHTRPHDIKFVRGCMNILAKRQGERNYLVNSTGQENASSRNSTIHFPVAQKEQKEMCRGTCSSVLRDVEATFVAVVTAQREDPSNGEWLRARVANAVASAQFGRKTGRFCEFGDRPA
jgi:Methyltransferase FkbM domain